MNKLAVPAVATLALLVSACPLYDAGTAFYSSTSLEEITYWVANNIDYEEDISQYGESDYWATPQETIDSGEGDCEDFAVLIAYIFYSNTGEKVEFSYQETELARHFAVKHEGLYYDPSKYFMLVSATPLLPEISIWSYDFIMSIAIHK